MTRLGLIAGGGDLPRRLAAAAREQGREVFILGLRGQTDPSLMQGFSHAWTRLGATSEAIDILKSNGVVELVMAGAVRRPALGDLKPDWRTLRAFSRLGLRALGDDMLLRAVAAELESEGLKVLGAHHIDPGLLAPEGVMGRIAPGEGHVADIETAARAARALGALDIGQGAVAQQGIVLGLEAVEGTDALIARCGVLRRKGRGGVLVKLPKPNQDRRLDLPAVGIRTVIKCHEAGLEGIAVGAGGTLILDRAAVADVADRLGLFLMGVAP